MVEKWIEANRQAEATGDWAKALGEFYTEDCEYLWNMGPNSQFRARGRQQICDWALGYWMKGFEQWKYPYHDIIIDEKRGTVICFYKHIFPKERPNGGGQYEVAGCNGTWFEYGGNYKWRWQRDWFDLENVKSITFELAGAGLLDVDARKKIHNHARGIQAPGLEPLLPDPGIWTKVKNFCAMIRIALIG